MLLPDVAGIDTLFTVVKGTFGMSPDVPLLEEQQPIIVADVHHGDPATTSIRLPADVCLGKPGTDVVLLGSAWAPGGRATWQMDVEVAVGPVRKQVRVLGDRVWNDDGVGGTASWVAPFERMPLVWERGFGGADLTEKGPTAEPRNPVGSGYRVSGGQKPLAGLPLPNVEDPAAPVGSWKDAPAPAGFAPIAPHWEPRRSFAGTYDDAWQRQRAPYLPDDFDARFFHIAPPGMTTGAPLRGGELVELRGVTPDGYRRFNLPTVTVVATYRVGAALHPLPGVLDTVILEPDAGRFQLVWRAAFRCDKQALRVADVHVDARRTA